MVRGVPTCRSRRARHRSNRGFPGTWEILPSPSDPSVVGVPEPKTPGPPSLRLGRWERKPRRTVWYHQAKATKRGGRGGRKSQRLDSTEEALERDHPERGDGR